MAPAERILHTTNLNISLHRVLGDLLEPEQAFDSSSKDNGVLYEV